MAIKPISYKGNRHQFICDTPADVASLPECRSGCSALIVSTGEVYMVNASGSWTLLPSGAVTKEYLDDYIGAALGGEF